MLTNTIQQWDALLPIQLAKEMSWSQVQRMQKDAEGLPEQDTD
jgi:hypothetical protein